MASISSRLGVGGKTRHDVASATPTVEKVGASYVLTVGGSNNEQRKPRNFTIVFSEAEWADLIAYTPPAA